METKCDDITELKIVTVDITNGKSFVYFDKLQSGKWRCVMTKDMEDKFIIIDRE